MKRLLLLLMSSYIAASTFHNKVSVECDMEVKDNETTFGNPRLYINGRPAECKCHNNASYVSVKNNVVASFCPSCEPKKKSKEEVDKK